MSLEPQALRVTHARLIDRLYDDADAARWPVRLDAFVAALAASVAHRFRESVPAADEIAGYLQGLHVGDVALALACREGNDMAWEHFIRECRPGLYASARAIAGEDGRDLADGLYAELFGIDDRRGDRRSLLAYYHGRSRLSTWLRSVLVQRQIDRRRAAARLSPFDEEVSDAVSPNVARPVEPDRAPYVRMAQSALDSAIAALDDRDRLRLRLHYGHGLTLARIGQLTGEHEATVSRKLERARKGLRQAVEATLRTEHGLSEAAIVECLDAAASAPELHLSRLLAEGQE